MSDSSVIASMRAAVNAAPDDVPLRLHLAELLLASGTHGAADEAASHAAVALQAHPTSFQARALMARALGLDGATPAAPEAGSGASGSASAHSGAGGNAEQSPPAREPAVPPAAESAFDWQAAERDVGDIHPPMFVEGGDVDAGDAASEPAFDVESSQVRLADVAGMAEVKDRLEAAFLAPMRNTELRQLYGKRLSGGLLLYGPPGCGKTFIARAVAGELGARFMTVSLADVLDMYIGASERNLQEMFGEARQASPCVLFLDELDAIGQKRSNLRNNAMRTAVNQLLIELDENGSRDEGVFVLAATNHPWDIDTALRRPGRLDRTILVLPPDEPAREAILRAQLQQRPVAGIDLAALVRRTDGYTGADLVHACETAAERAILDSARSGRVRMIEMSDMEAALSEVRPSTGPWFDTARNVAQFANEGGAYDDLLAYLKRRRML